MTQDRPDRGGASAPTSPAPPSSRIDSGLEVLSRLQLERPWWFIFGMLLSTALSLMLARRLELHTALGELLPANKESVIIADRINERLARMSTLLVVAEGQDNAGLQRFVDALAPELRKIDPTLVGSVDEGVQKTEAFFKEHRMLYAPLDLVQQVHDEIQERHEYEVAKQMGTLLDEDSPPPPITEASIRERIEARAEKATAGMPKFYHGYYLDEQKHVAVVRVLTGISAGDVERTKRLTDAVEGAIARVEPKRFDPAVRVGLSGNLLSGAETYTMIKNDLTHVGLWGVSAVLLVVFLYYLRFRALFAMLVTVGTGTSWTFGLAYLTVGHLNSSTGFLFSIIVGNGINFSIIYMARYLEERRVSDVRASILAAHRETWQGTLTAAAAASAAYGSLAVTDFRGFKHFGLIGGTGMALCWISSYLFLPVVLGLFDRLSPIVASANPIRRLAGQYGRPFAALVGGAPRLVVTLAALATLGGGVLSYRYLKNDPMDYDMNNIDNALPNRPTEVRRLARVASKVVGRLGSDGIAISVDRVDQVLPLKAALEERLRAAPPDKKPFQSVVSIFSLLPSDQPKKIELINQARSTLERARRRGSISDADWDKLQELLPKGELRPLGIEDLPEQVAQPFTENDGTRGRLLYIEPSRTESLWDGRYLIRWAESFRRTELPDGSVIKGSGRSVIFADMIVAIGQDAPRAIVTSFLATITVLFLAFRSGRASLWVIGSVVVGLLWTTAVMAVWRSTWPWQGHFAMEPMRLNFLNFVALPITIGVGADYAVNVLQRHRIAGGDIKRVVFETGGAVTLCSLTTTVGYLALTLSLNRAIQSFGIAAAVGEVCALLTGVLVLPACLELIARRKA